MGREKQTCAEMSCFLFYFIFLACFSLKVSRATKAQKTTTSSFNSATTESGKLQNQSARQMQSCVSCVSFRIFLHSFCCFGMRNFFFPN